MIANYHTHTPRCNHASGAEEKYVQCALDAGMQILGFSDHTPYPFPNGYYSTFRMRPEELPDYVATVETMRKRYAGQIQIHLGVEAEYYPGFFKEMVQMVRDQGIEYMLLGQHLLYDEIEGIGTGAPTADRVLLKQYCDQTIEAMYTGLFTYFAHPDIMNFVGDGQIYRQEMGRLCRAAKACGVPLEINLLGMQLQRQYPAPRFLEIVAEEGCQVVLGVDAHKPQELLDKQMQAQGRELAERFGLEILQTVPLIHI
ncbi:MAG: PHP domain-containing protein [Ruminococcaceae bacterium]|nr:PHP domain-containing protein [Oscillospiraceae bacterium]